MVFSVMVVKTKNSLLSRRATPQPKNNVIILNIANTTILFLAQVNIKIHSKQAKSCHQFFNAMSFYCSFYRNSSFYKTHSDWMRKYSIQQFFQKLHTKSTEREQIVENNKISWFKNSIFKFPFVAFFCAFSIDFLKSFNKLLVYGLFLLIANINLKADAKLQQWEIKKIFPLLSFLR